MLDVNKFQNIFVPSARRVQLKEVCLLVYIMIFGKLTKRMSKIDVFMVFFLYGTYHINQQILSPEPSMVADME